MLPLDTADPSPLAQAAVYMTGILLGYTLLTPTEEMQRAWQRVRNAWTRRKE
ncbi:MAG: hypothetical protein ACREL3_11905 [Gemmatimonadales bacterium]